MSEWRDYSQPAAPDPDSQTAEERRLLEARAGVPWRRWGPYLSERQWGTVREDYSDNGDAWNVLQPRPGPLAAYRWGEDGLAGISDDKQRLCFALALWNERDPILKERLFGLTNCRGQPRRGRQGVLLLRRQPADALLPALALQVPAGRVPVRRPGDSEPSPVAARDGVRAASTPASSTTTATSTSRSSTPRPRRRTSCAAITVHNRGPSDAVLHVLPTLWFRNTWSWRDGEPRPRLAHVTAAQPVVRAEHHQLGTCSTSTPSRGGPAVLRERDQHGAAVGRRGCDALPQGRHRRPRPARHGRPSIPPARAPRRRCTVRLEVPAGGAGQR